MSKSPVNRIQATYVVRVYRRDPSQPDTMVGVIEDVQAGRACSFHDSAELLRILRGEVAPAESAAPPARDEPVRDGP